MPCPRIEPVVVLLLVLIGIGSGCEDSLATPRDPVARRAAKEIAVALQDDGTTLDPHKATDAASMHLLENLYSGLLRYAPQYGEVEADLAERWDVSPDGRTYTFHLRPGAWFHSGRMVTPADVRYSIERIREMKSRAAHFAAVQAIETPDERTVVFRLSEPFAPLLTYLAHPMNAVVDRQVIEANGGSLDRADAGAGPFRLVEWRRAQHMVMERHDAYHVPGLPKLERVVFLPMPDATSRTIALRNREIDMILDVTGRGQRVLRDEPGILLDTSPGTFWEYVGINTSHKPLDDVRVRQAIAHAVDREAINNAVKLGAATVLPGAHIPPGHWAHAGLELYPKRDVERAKALLAEAGIMPGTVTLVCKVGSAFPYQVAAGQMIKQQLRDVGIEVQLLAQESGVFFDALGKGEFDLTVVGWVGFVDPDEWMDDLFHSTGKYNQQKYSNPEVDALLDRGRRAMGRDERVALYRQVQEVIAREAPMVFLYANDQTTGRLSDVEGFVVHPTASTIFLREAHFRTQPTTTTAPLSAATERETQPTALVVPISDRCAPTFNRCAPIFRRSAPILDRRAPILDRYAPISDRCAPITDRCAPTFDRCVSTSDRCAPIFDHYAPSLARCAPIFGQSSSSSDHFAHRFDRLPGSLDGPSLLSCSGARTRDGREGVGRC